MIIVFGSINIDLVAKVARIAAPGETVLSPSYALIPGGKGANQALAARRAGAKVRLVGAIGRDGFGQQALALLRADGVDVRGVALVDAPTGAAFIAVDAAGENAITVAAGANGLAQAAQIGTIAAGDILLLQREVPDAQGMAAALMAQRAGARVILNLAPAGYVSEEYLSFVDVLVMNEHEVQALGAMLGMKQAAPDEVAAMLDREMELSAVVTLGAAGAMAFHRGLRLEFAAPKVDVIDTTAAGDAFVGAFAAALAAGAELALALRHGLAGGSLACLTHGAQPSLPSAQAIAGMLARM